MRMARPRAEITSGGGTLDVGISGAGVGAVVNINILNHTTKAELTEYLRGCSSAFDAIVSADTLVYFGPLEEVVAAAENALRDGGSLVFTVEELRDGGDYEITPNGRYRHSRDYLERVLGEAGMQPDIVPWRWCMGISMAMADLTSRPSTMISAI